MTKYAMRFDNFLTEAIHHHKIVEHLLNEAEIKLQEITAKRKEIQVQRDNERNKLKDMLSVKKMNPQNFDQQAFNMQKELVVDLQNQYLELTQQENQKIEAMVDANIEMTDYENYDESPRVGVEQPNIASTPQAIKPPMPDNVTI